MKYIPAEKLIAEIERRIEETKSMKPSFDQFWAGQISAFKGAIKIAESLQQEQPEMDLEEAEAPSEELNKAAEEYARDETMSGLAERAFKAGAEWQEEQYEGIPTEEAYMRGFAQSAKEEREKLTPLINRLCEAILFEWKDAAELARKIQAQIREE